MTRARLALAALVLTACSIPSGDELHEAAQCLRDAEDLARGCVMTAAAKIEAGDRLGQAEAVECALAFADDIAACADQLGDAF